MPRNLKTGEYLTADESNDLLDLRAAMLRPQSSGMIGMQNQSNGFQVTDLRDSEILARITSQGSGSTAAAYGWNSVTDNGDGTYTDCPLVPECPYGSPTEVPAWERSGSASVPTTGSVIVKLRPAGLESASYSFSYLPSGGGSGVTGFWARITGASSGLYSWTQITSGGTATWSDTSTTSGGAFNAAPVPFWDGNAGSATTPAIETGTRAWMYPSLTPGYFEFLTWQAADAVTYYTSSGDGTPGIVSTADQSFVGPKRFNQIVYSDGISISQTVQSDNLAAKTAAMGGAAAGATLLNYGATVLGGGANGLIMPQSLSGALTSQQYSIFNYESINFIGFAASGPQPAIRVGFAISGSGNAELRSPTGIWELAGPVGATFGFANGGGTLPSGSFQFTDHTGTLRTLTVVNGLVTVYG